MKNNLLSDAIQLQIIEYIARGIYEQDMLLPSVRSFALSMGVNPNTVQKSYQKLEEEGHIVSVLKKGSYVKDVVYSKKVYFNHLLTNFETSVKQMHKANIEQNELLKVIDKIYQGGNK